MSTKDSTDSKDSIWDGFGFAAATVCSLAVVFVPGLAIAEGLNNSFLGGVASTVALCAAKPIFQAFGYFRDEPKR